MFRFQPSRTLAFQGRVFFLFLLLCNIQLNARSFAQTVTINRNQVTIDEVFRDIHRQTGYEFIYNSDVLSAQKTVDIHVTNAPVTEVLNICLKNLPVAYTIKDKVIMVRAVPPAAASKETSVFATEIKGKVIDADGKPLSYASVQVVQTGITTVCKVDGTFEVAVPDRAGEVTLVVSYVGKTSVTKTISEKQFGTVQLIVLKDLSLKLDQVEINGVRKKTLASNSSIVFDREAIEQTQALSVTDVLKYLPGQSMVRPGATLQGSTVLTLRNVTLPNSEQELNNAFGVSMQIDGVTVNNNANMQSMNPGRMGLISSNNISTPNTLGDLSAKNGTLNSNYNGDVANSGVDLRQLQTENIENIEVISGVASARYGDYSTGVVIINRQAGITPLRASVRANEGTQNFGVSKGFAVSPALGVVNLSLDYLNSNDDPRNQLKSYDRLGGALLWTYHKKAGVQFKNTLSFDYNTTLDKTRVDPDDINQRMTRMGNRMLRVSNRSEWIVKKPWLYNVNLQMSYSRERQESYSQYYLNLRPVIGIADSDTTGTYEGYWAPGYYMAEQEVIGEPVTAAARIETSTFIKIKKMSYRLMLGSNFNYSANKGPGVIVFADRPRFYQTGNKSDRARSYNYVPTQKNLGFYVENLFNTRLLDRYYTLNLGARADVQNQFFVVSPRINSNWRILRNLNWSFSYGIATKSPSLSQISPGNVYIDIPLANTYTGNADESLYLVHTRVVQADNSNLKPYRSRTFETGFSWDAKPFHASVHYFDRLMDNGFSTLTQLVPVVLPNYKVTPISGAKPAYEENGTYKTYNVTYNKINNGNYNHTRGFELMMSTDKIKSLATSFNMSLAYYSSYYLETNDEVSIPASDASIDYTRKSVYGVYSNQQSKGKNIKSTFTTTTHIPDLRLAVMLTGEVYWMNRSETMGSGVYPAGYLDKDLNYYSLTDKEARSADYAHLLRSPREEAVKRRPSFVYPNMHLRLSKEIGDYLRFSFNAFNAFNIRPTEIQNASIYYYNGRPSFGAELVFTIK